MKMAIFHNVAKVGITRKNTKEKCGMKKSTLATLFASKQKIAEARDKNAFQPSCNTDQDIGTLRYWGESAEMDSYHEKPYLAAQWLAERLQVIVVSHKSLWGRSTQTTFSAQMRLLFATKCNISIHR